jgi:hypothetical protein
LKTLIISLFSSKKELEKPPANTEILFAQTAFRELQNCIFYYSVIGYNFELANKLKKTLTS